MPVGDCGQAIGLIFGRQGGTNAGGPEARVVTGAGPTAAVVLQAGAELVDDRPRNAVDV